MGYVADWLIKAENHIEREGEPLIEPPSRLDRTLYAMDWGGDEVQLTLGNPYEEPHPVTWREYLADLGYSGFHEYYDSNNPTSWRFMDIDERVPQDLYIGGLDLLKFSLRTRIHIPGRTRSGARSARRHGPGQGEIRFYDGVAPGNDSRVVTVPDYLSLSLLQKRLNDLDQGTRVLVGDESLRNQMASVIGKRAFVGLQWQATGNFELAYAGTGCDYRIRS